MGRRPRAITRAHKFGSPQVRVDRTEMKTIVPLTGTDNEGGFVYRRSFPGPLVSLFSDSVVTDMLPKAKMDSPSGGNGSRKKEPEKKPKKPATPKTPSTANKVEKKQPGKKETEKAEYPPITPLAALGYTLVISRVSSSDADKRKISHKAMDELADLDKNYRRDERARSFIQAVRTLIITSGIAIGESNKLLNRKLEITAECTKDNIHHHRDIRDMRLEYLEKSKTVKTLPSVTAWLASLGVSVTAIATLKTEIMNLAATYYPKVQDIEHLFYVTGASLLAGAVLGVRKLMNRLLNKRQEKTKNGFQEKKKDEQDQFRAVEEDAVSTHVAKTVGIAASVYIQVLNLCETYYPGYLELNPQYKEYLEVKKSQGADKAQALIKKIGKAEAENRLKKRFFEEKGKDFATMLSNGCENS